MALGKKQTLADSKLWTDAFRDARLLWPDDKLDRLLDRTVDEIKRTIKGKRVGYGWSGGKDSLALEIVMRHAGVEDCVLAISSLEYPAMLQWITDNMPDGLTILNTGLDLPWLRAHPEMLFPQGRHGPRWFQLVNHKGQELYFHRRNLDLIILGRRHADGNYTGPKGQTIYTNRRGVTRYSPLHDWSHEAVYALMEREGVELPPCYSWPRGWQVGTGSWPARQWTESVDHGFEEVWQIDPDVIREAAPELPQARDWLQRTGRE